MSETENTSEEPDKGNLDSVSPEFYEPQEEPDFDVKA